MKILVFSVPSPSLRREIVSKGAKEIVLSIPTPLSMLLFILWLRRETVIRYIGFDYSSILIFKLTLRKLIFFIKRDRKELFRVISGISIFYSKDQNSYRALIDSLDEKDIKVNKYWLSRELLINCARKE